MAVNFGFENGAAARQIVFLEVRGGNEDVQLGGIFSIKTKAARLGDRFLEHFERRVRQAVEEVKLAGEPEPGGKIVRRQLADAGEGRNGLADHRRAQQAPFSKQKLVSLNGPLALSTSFQLR